MQWTKEELQFRMQIENNRIASIDKNIEGMVIQRGKSQDELARYQALYEALPEPEEQQAGV
jgi:hypothetical protein